MQRNDLPGARQRRIIKDAAWVNAQQQTLVFLPDDAHQPIQPSRASDARRAHAKDGGIQSGLATHCDTQIKPAQPADAKAGHQDAQEK
ncbi:hypothetical protein V8J88_11565 [Massilia sp. W12]|uniref:hypothetical protein n=1 Tax=Massilia sp. W12 TaxID=3126507 RepID=UPI0030D0B28D